MSPDDITFEEMQQFIHALKSSTTIPKDVDAAFRKRFASSLGLTVSNKGADSEDQAVDEGGSSTYFVLGDPVGFLEVDINGTTYHIAHY